MVLKFTYDTKEACKFIVNPKGFKLAEENMLLYKKRKKQLIMSRKYTDDFFFILKS